MVPQISRRWLLLGGALMIGLLFLSVTLAIARTGPSLTVGSNVPSTVSFQGTVSSNGQAFSGMGNFKFAIVDHAGSLAFWTNDGSNLSMAPFTPTASVPLSVTNGVFSVLLGDITQTGMTQPLTPNIFNTPDRAVRVWFDDGLHGVQQLSPDAPLASVPFAFNAQTLDGLDSSAFAPISHTHSEYLTRTLADTLYDHRPPNMILVAPVRGDFTSIQAAINSVVSPSVSNPYLIVVAPGMYTESITLRPYVDVQGSGANLTTITHDGSAPTVSGADHSELRSLTVINTGGGDTATGIYNRNAAPSLRDLVVQVSGSVTNTGIYNLAVLTDTIGQFSDPVRSTEPALVNSRVAVSGGVASYGLYNGASIATAVASTQHSVTLSAIVQGSRLDVRGGSANYGLYAISSLTAGGAAIGSTVEVWLEVRDSTVQATGGTTSMALFETHHETIGGLSDNNTIGTWSTIADSTLSASGAAASYGLYHSSVVTGTERIQHSQIVASTATITGTGGAAYVGASQLSGGPAGGLTITCAGVYDENYAFFTNTCP